jgi:hypothetical protein
MRKARGCGPFVVQVSRITRMMIRMIVPMPMYMDPPPVVARRIPVPLG